MEEIKNLDLEKVLEVIKDFPVKPRRGRLIITVNVEEADSELVLNNSQFAETQFVLAVPGNITDINPGDRVLLDVEKMMVFEPVAEDSGERRGHIKLNPIEVNGVMYAIISESVVLATDNR